MPLFLKEKGILTGIKVDSVAKVLANSKHETPTSTIQLDLSINSISLKDFLVEITAPLTPASLTKIFVPFPSQVIIQSFDFKK